MTNRSGLVVCLRHEDPPPQPSYLTLDFSESGLRDVEDWLQKRPKVKLYFKHISTFVSTEVYKKRKIFFRVDTSISCIIWWSGMFPPREYVGKMCK